MRRNRRPYEARKRDMQEFYEKRPPSKNNVTWDVIQCYFRYGLTLQDTAEILNLTTDTVDSAIDIIKQNAQ